MNEISRYEDWLLLCSMHGLGQENWGIFGLAIDVIGFTLITGSAYFLATSRRELENLSVRARDAAKAHLQTHKTRNSEAFEKFCMWVLLFIPPINRPNDIRTMENCVEHFTRGEMIFLIAWPKLKEKFDAEQRTEFRDVLRTWQSSIVSERKFKERLNRDESMELTGLLVGGILVVSGFLLQILGSVPCPSFQLPSFLGV